MTIQSRFGIQQFTLVAMSSYFTAASVLAQMTRPLFIFAGGIFLYYVLTNDCKALQIN